MLIKKKKYFGTDGIRGKVGESIINPEFVLKLGFAAGNHIKHKTSNEHPVVIIGKDTRISGYMLESLLQAGFTASGVKVLLTGPIPTPAISYLTRALRLDGGVMISASHNPYYDNGIKFFDEHGIKLSDNDECLIENELNSSILISNPDNLGKAKRIEGAVYRYIEFCKSTFPNEMNLRNLKIVVDTANGAAYSLAEKVFHELGADVIPIGNNPNGFNINNSVGVMHINHLQENTLKYNADFGIALDGDGDRLIMVDENGQIYDGDSLIYIIAKAKKKFNILSGGVVGTVMTNMAMENALKSLNIPFMRTQVGDKYVLEKLIENNWTLGGEASGHILCLDKHNTGDGIISALQVIQSLKSLSQSLKEARDWEPFSQVLINVRIDKNSNWEKESKNILDEINNKLMVNNLGRVVLRKSGTEPVVRIMVESIDNKIAKEYAEKIAQTITS